MSTLKSKAPEFTLKNTQKEDISLSNFKGKPVVLAFYPGAFTGVCDTEMCKLKEDMEIFNVIPPSLDKMNRWITENQNSLQDSNQEKEVQDEGEQDKQSGLWTP